MKQSNKPTKKFLILMSILFGIQIIVFSYTVMFTPYTFLRGLNLLVVIVLSFVTGTFVRELFIAIKENR
ncbi:hypothetical protein H0266_15170 [Halobacillus locisalis]|uniref:Uncharacterized protein n=1 Tax=Halobacillus locisalis TaxID=220753 RepID=A0A838CW13_9BACI|nr:hypothetical protein [Halobacillus locisalis]MBA2176237.1 hypothetical protein [Halobacillus locisalis]